MTTLARKPPPARTASSPWYALTAALLLLSATPGLAAPPRYEVLHNFVKAVDGANPVGPLTLASDGLIYGTTNAGGAQGLGTIFRATQDGSITVVRPFAGADDVGAFPSGLSLANDGNLYGVTQSGGRNGDGALYRVTPSGEAATLLAFSRSGDHPYWALAAPVQGTDGLLYGTSMFGGIHHRGTAYRLALDGSQLEFLYQFGAQGRPGKQGHYPSAGLTQATDGTWYGVTSSGARLGCGAAFKLSDQRIETLRVFAGPAEGGKCPVNGNVGNGPRHALLAGPDGRLYGTTYQAGDQGLGTLFRLSPGGHLRVLHEFSGLEPDGRWPNSPLVLGPDGAFYGTAASGNSGRGMIYRITRGGKFKVVFKLPLLGGEGVSPVALVLGPDGKFYGTTAAGGLHDAGVFFRLTL
jgi:uncharacterized repeat protein (TIGR03803 family)